LFEELGDYYFARASSSEDFGGGFSFYIVVDDNTPAGGVKAFPKTRNLGMIELVEDPAFFLPYFRAEVGFEEL
jgi:hypothetical protein